MIDIPPTVDLFDDFLAAQPVSLLPKPQSLDMDKHKAWWNGLSNAQRIDAIQRFRHDDATMTADEILAALLRGESLHVRGVSGEWQKIYYWNGFDHVLIETDWRTKATRRPPLQELPIRLGRYVEHGQEIHVVFYKPGDIPA